MQHTLDAFLALAGHHPTAALALIALVAFAESVAIIGSVVPAAVVMFGAGVLVGHGRLALIPTLAVAAAGAVVGDALSYELGRWQQQRVRSWLAFQRYESAIHRAEQLVGKHGAASVVIARFTGAVRAFVPLLAGFARMPRSKFYVTNVVSALLWAPAHILPGVVFGASLQLAEAASARLAALVLILAALLWTAGWLARFTIRTVVPLTRIWRARALQAAAKSSAPWARFAGLLLDPDQPGSQALLASLVLLLGGMWVFLGVLEAVASQDPLVVVDQAVFEFLQQLRTDSVDRVMVRITQLGSVGVMLPLVIAVAAWLLWRRCWRTAGYWLATAGCAELVVQILKVTLGRHRPLDLYEGIEQFSFPSGHATMSAVVLAYLAFLLARGQSIRWRLSVGAAVAIYVTLVGFSRLYLGAHWFSDVLGGFGFGLAGAALSAMVYTQHGVQEAMEPKRMALFSAAAIVLAGSAWSAWRLPADLQRYVATPASTLTTLQDWAAGGFRLLPSHRQEIAGQRKEMFTLQVACPESTLRDLLEQAGWRSGPSLSLSSVLVMIAPQPQLPELPVIPKYDSGRRSTLNLLDSDPNASGHRNVLRLWQSDWALTGGVPIWYGAFYREVLLRRNVGLVRGQAQIPPDTFRSRLEHAGLQRSPAVADGSPGLPELWSCLP